MQQSQCLRGYGEYRNTFFPMDVAPDFGGIVRAFGRTGVVDALHVELEDGLHELVHYFPERMPTRPPPTS